MAEWTRNQKLTLAGIIVAIVGIIPGLIVKINIDINYLQQEVEDLKIKNAEISSLKAEIARIDQLIAGSGNFDVVRTSACPVGTCPGISFGTEGTTQGCLPC